MKYAVLALAAFLIGYGVRSVPEDAPMPQNESPAIQVAPAPAPEISVPRAKPTVQSKRSRTTVLTIPRLDLRVRIVEGTDDAALARGVGRWTNDTFPGSKGNYVLAGHRVTHGEPFANMPRLRRGDRVYIDTKTYRFTYVMDTPGNYLRVRDEDVWVTQPNPFGRAKVRTNSWYALTLITCAETFHTDDRFVAFGHLAAVDRY